MGNSNNIYFFKNIFIYVLIFIIAVLIRVFAVQMKTELQFDEPFSYISSTPSVVDSNGELFKFSWNQFNLEFDKYYTGRELKSLFFAINPSVNSIVKDLKIIRTQNIERQHPSLYLFIFRLWNIGVDGLNVKNMINRGCALNFIFFSLSFFFLFKLLSLIKNDKKFISVGLFFGFMSISSIAITILIRSYALQECLFILVNYLFLIIQQNILEKRNNSFLQNILFSIAFALFLLSGYFSLIYLGIIFSFIFLLCIFTKNYSFIKHFILMVLISLFVTLAFYPIYFDFHTNNEHIGTISQYILFFNDNNFRLAIWVIFSQILKYIISPIICISAILWVLSYFLPKNKIFDETDNLNKNEKVIIIELIAICLIWSIVSMYIAPYKFLRYIIPATTIFSLILSVGVYRFKNSILIPLMILFTIFQVCYSHFRVYDPFIGMQFPFTRNKLISPIIYDGVKNNVPIIFADFNWFNPNYYAVLGNNQIVKFIYPDNLDLYEFKKQIVVVSIDDSINNPNIIDKSINYMGRQKIYLINN